MSEILCIIDGMSDSRFCADNYEGLRAFPERGKIQTVPKGCEPQSHICIPFLLGVERPPVNVRGWLEAVGMGILHKKSDLIFRGTWVKLHKDGKCAGLADAPEALLVKCGSFRYRAVGGHKSIFVFEGLADRLQSVKTADPDQIAGQKPIDLLPHGIPEISGEISRINSASADKAVVLWGASKAAELPRKKGAVVCGSNLVRGIAVAMGMELCANCRMTGDTDTSLDDKICTTLDAAKRHSFVLLHIGGADEASHRLNRAEKELFLRETDRKIAAKLLDSPHNLTIVSDHGAEPETGAHTGELQPVFRRYSE